MKWPEKWEDLTKKELDMVVPLIWQMKYQGDDYDTVIVIAERLLYCIGHKKLSEKEIIAGIDRIKWMLNEDITKRPYEYVIVAGKKRYLPRENFADTVGIELAMANMYYLMFATAASGEVLDSARTDNGGTKESVGDAYKYLWILLALICRPSTRLRLSNRFWGFFSIRNQDIVREVFDNVKAEKLAMEFAGLPIGTVLAILNYWETQNKMFMEQYSNVLKDGNGEALFANGEGWIASLEDVAKDGVHGDFERVSNTNVHTIWTYLSHQKTIAKAQEKANKS